MDALHFEEARSCVLAKLGAVAPGLAETVPLLSAVDRVLAAEIRSDRDYPPADRSIRDGFAVNSADLPGRLRVTGEVRAGGLPHAELLRGTAVEIMTGGIVPAGADAVVMVEHLRRDGERIVVDQTAKPGQFINPRAAESREGETLLRPGVRLDYSHIALLALTGATDVQVYPRPRVAIVSTGDEIVGIGEPVLPHQIRNSNAQSLAAQAARAGGVPEILPVALDNFESTREMIERGFEADLLLLSGGVSAGKYDVVEPVLRSLDAEFYFDRVLIQPGQPLVFGRVRDKFFFGLPGNPASTMVTFEVFARTAIQMLGGDRNTGLRMPLARLTTEFRHKPGLTRFLPACLSGDGESVSPLPWHGSSDVPALARANAFLVAASERERWEAGDLIRVLLK